MEWHPRAGNPDELVLRCDGVRVGWVARAGSRWLARVRAAHLHLIALFARRGDAQRFVERELWSEAGELVSGTGAPHAATDAETLRPWGDVSRAAAAPVHRTLRSTSSK